MTSTDAASTALTSSATETVARTRPAREPGEGSLVLAATPIGNLGDATERLKEYLGTADVIAVEDTRRLRTLASGLGVATAGKVVTNHDHNEAHRAEELAQAVRSGQTVLLVSDAGMPTVSDPGFRVVRRVVEEGLRVTCAPGPSAVLAALAVSGLPSDRFAFEGFLPRKASDRRAHLAGLAQEWRTLVFYEAPHRLPAMLEALQEACGPQRRAVVCRELTKLHEEVLRGTLEELLAWSQENTVRGEIAVVLAGAPEPEPEQAEDLTEEVEARVVQGQRLKQACAEVAQAHGVGKRDLYESVLSARGRA